MESYVGESELLSSTPSTIVPTFNVTSKENHFYSSGLCLYLYGWTIQVRFLQVWNCYVNPICAIIGFTGNMLSIEILRRSNLKKPSNILLLSLVVADSFTLLSGMNYAEILMVWGPNLKYEYMAGWQYGDNVNMFLCVSIIAFYFLAGYGSHVSSIIPVIITVERLLAVFLPITFKKIVTTKNAITAVVLSYIVCLPWFMAFTTYYGYSKMYAEGEDYMAFVGLNSKYQQNEYIINLFNHYILGTLTTWVPIAFVSISCTFIAVKVTVTLRARKQMSVQSKIQWSPRTTLVLLLTCLIFTIAKIIQSLIFVFILSASDEVFHSDFYFFVLGNYMWYFVLVIGSSSNFFVYVLSNRKLMNIFVDIIHCRKTKKESSFRP
ncbi:G-protein coupled receptor [Biomphalaria glabrata]